MPDAPSMQFAVKHAGLSLKITLDAKWQARPLLTSVVAPFVKSFNKKRPDYDAVHDDGLAAILVRRGLLLLLSPPVSSRLLSSPPLLLLCSSRLLLPLLRCCSRLLHPKRLSPIPNASPPSHTPLPGRRQRLG